VSAKIIPFPHRGPFVVTVMRDGGSWLVFCRGHGWTHGDINAAFDDADEIAEGFAVQVKVRRERP
jgi:hypothetical protein